MPSLNVEDAPVPASSSLSGSHEMFQLLTRDDQTPVRRLERRKPSYTRCVRKSKLMADLRRERQQRELAMTPAERFALADQLCERSLQMYMSAHGLDRESALRAIRKTRQFGRRPSACMSSRDADQ